MQRLLQSVERLARLAQRDAGLPAVQRVLGEELVAVLGVDQAHVVVLAAGHPGCGVVALRGAGSAEYVLPHGEVPDALRWVADAGHPVTVPDARVDGALPAELVRTYGLATAAVLPLQAGDTVRAVVVLGSRVARTWSEEELHQASALADLAGTAIALRDARLAAAIDPLTGCLNHGAMRERLSEEIARARRQGTPLAITILDLDDFKRVNDTYGHLTGDALLRHVAEALRGEYRSFDQVARYGGDEFVVILPNVRGPRADIAAARALRVLREIHIARPDGGHEGITVSCGVAEWVEPEGPAELLERADKALRGSKAAGKDGVVRAPTPAR
ncbi:MAG TPA: GGDEF domain-containing protein [Baekduia sp.]|uniref:GGDEF domain-containing protein n=1 Tax=Baekduia sp. TaxID=2600305 RepID=UPI002B81EA87|nr:GGDEF domain-containing protein [Baekduia sp.]HMJ37061.1 GGDEF domain-containing protein [Baekduia sp.]